MADHPKVENTPGLTWRACSKGWEARWRARSDLVKRGYIPKVVRLWSGAEPTEMDVLWLQDRSNVLQNDMLLWANGGCEIDRPFDGTLGDLIRCYKTDPASAFHKMRYASRMNCERHLERIRKDHGNVALEDINTRLVIAWHKGWLGEDGKRVASAHDLVARLRTLCSFGMTLLENQQCERLSMVLGKTRFQMSRPRTERMTATQANAIRATAHAEGWHSIALAQAFQFDLMLRQKDVIGEWIPNSEPGVTDVAYTNEKWMIGLRWTEIDENLILRHRTSKRSKDIEVNLMLAPMVMEELARLGERPKAGPIIVSEYTGRPFTAIEFRRRFRVIARKAGVPDAVKNMDSRAGGITEATDAGAELEHVRHAATHSDISMTQKYSRGSVEKVDNVMRLRAAHRNKDRTE